ncbi:TolC family protein [Noviherbaspirillum sedimenti]|uniref:TolC family protein n=1 Tax=Noviherbaspirillum sedimenti TaxID=2320865 RepID=A0A3A3G9U2_9BURK|nr:TolC family protein [Noviherbaspirillum sedimenti]RJG03509.1 TolC family protein [Noviherbaspirillum sedimenti]
MRAHYLIHRICFLTALAFATPSAFSQAVAPDLKTAVNAAWQRSPQARTLEARRDEMLAGREAAQTWIAGSPSIGLSQRSDRWTDQNGVRETEVSLSAPIWLPGQKSARQALAQTGSEDLEAQIANARLALAGEVRERLWAVAAARENLTEVQNQQRYLEAIAGDVMRRVKAGDLARTDGMLARQEVLAAKAAALSAQAKVQEELARYRTLTGQSEIPTPQPEPVGKASQESHSRILATRAALESAQASLDVVNRTRSDPPTIGVSMRRERDRPANPASHSVSIGVQIPIGTAARNRPLETAARTKIETATAEVAQAEATVRADVELARQHLAAAEQALDAASMRAALTREHTQLIEKAFRLGERGLAELLRSQALSHEAEVGERQQRVAVGLAHARLNQALGIMP